jgi:hypothetical protein
MTRWLSWLAILTSALLGIFTPPVFAQGLTSCTMEFKLEGWSALYETASGKGTIKCTNGQTANVSRSSKGGGITFGKMKIVDGTGTFSEVKDINELFGDYTFAEAEAADGKAAEARVMTKGKVSLALAGKGEGTALGTDFGKFSITKQE